MNKLIILIVFLSCAHVNKLSLKELSKLTPYSISTEKVEDGLKLIKQLETEHKYLESIFEQSYDPYYGTPKWSQECLSENIIEPIRKTPRGIFLITTLHYNWEKKPGFCSSSTTYGSSYIQTIKYYCYHEPVLNILTIDTSVKLTKNFKWTDLCN